MNNNITYSKQDKELIRTKNKYHFREGLLRQFYKEPLGIISVFLSVTALITTLIITDTPISGLAISPPIKLIISIINLFADNHISVTALIPAFTFTVKSVVIFVFIVLLVRLLTWIGTPKNANQIDSHIAVAFNVEQHENFYKRPFIISITPVKSSGEVIYTFYSEYFSIDRWKTVESDILHTLKFDRVDEYRAGKNKHVVILHVSNNIKREPPTDPLFR